MENKKEMTTPNVSAATDTEQPFPKCTEHSIADCDENIKSFEEMQREMLRQLSPSYLKTVASVDKGTHGFSRGKTTSGVVILVGGRQPACLVCLASRRLSSVKNSEGLAGWSGALSARQRTQTSWRMSRTITRQTAAQSDPQACVPLSTDAINGGFV